MSSDTRVFTGILHATCRYGENGHQKPAGLYSDPVTDDSLALHRFRVIAGPEPSYNNYCDIDRLLQTMTHAAAALNINAENKQLCIALAAKHGNCCGASFDENHNWALQGAVAGDERAIFGGVVMISRTMTAELAETLLYFSKEKRAKKMRRFLSVVVAPKFEEEATVLLRGRENRCCLLENKALGDRSSLALDTSLRFRHVRGGFLVQPNYLQVPHVASLECIGRKPDEEQTLDVALAWAVGATSNSNTITLVRKGMLLGNGVGQQDRVGAAELACKRAMDAGHSVEDAVAYSDSFFPFSDGPERLADAGVQIIFATSGSIRDKEIQEKCIERNVTLLFVKDSEGRGFFGH
ncbi:MAG: hypothetical protein Q8R25_02255 [bacterium]|nr:hypothetical protein [bacterium]